MSLRMFLRNHRATVIEGHNVPEMFSRRYDSRTNVNHSLDTVKIKSFPGATKKVGSSHVTGDHRCAAFLLPSWLRKRWSR